MYRQLLKSTPREVLNWRLLYAVICFGLMGAARGLDEGLISSTVAQKSFIEEFGLQSKSLSKSAQANLLSNITSMVQIGSVAGSLIAFILCDKIGRIWATRQLCVVWIVGVIVFITSRGNVGQVYAGRFLMGLGIGQTTVVAPTYLAETTPRSIRGLCVCVFSGSVYLGIMLGYFASWGTSLHISNHSPRQWFIPQTMHLIFSSIILLMTLFAKESPRFLMKTGQQEKAAQTMSYLRNLPVEHPYVRTELIDINDQLEREREATLGSGWIGPLKELCVIPSNRYRLMIGLMAQLLGQWSGANSITIYAPEFFALLGTTGQTEKLFATAIFGVVKFVSAIACALFLVDFIGRKRSLTYGILLQLLSMLYIAIYLTAVPAVTADKVKSSATKHASTGAIVFIYFSGVGWALGWNSIQYLVNAEIFPLRVRSLGTSLVMCFHFINQYGNSKAVPSMLLETSMKPQGTFWFFSAVTLLGLFWVWFFLPETAGKSLEAMDEMFSLPWYIIGRQGAAMTAGQGSVADAYDGGDVEKIANAEQTEEIEHAERQ